MALLIVVVALLGLAIGSFLNVVVYRVPLHQSLSHPPSRCPACEHPIRHRHNIPVLSWLLLRGRCADCRTHISVRYPLVELGTAAIFIAVTLRLAHLGWLAALPAFLFFAAVGIALSLIDLDVRRLPNAIVYPSYPVLAVLLGVAAIVGSDLSALVRAILGAVLLFGFYFVLAFAYPAGMGFGDVKLAGIVGAVLGFLSYSSLLIGAFAAFLLGSIVGVSTILSGRGTGRTAIPFGPFMFTGALLAVFVAGPIAGLYSGTLSHA